jgi:hypothetical protein
MGLLGAKVCIRSVGHTISSPSPSKKSSMVGDEYGWWGDRLTLPSKPTTDLAQRVGSTMIDLPPHGCGGRAPMDGFTASLSWCFLPLERKTSSAVASILFVRRHPI